MYLVKNPAWPGMVKVGSAADYEQRCRKYQTGDPYRAYEVIGALPFSDRLAAESAVLHELRDHHVSGEWFQVSEGRALHVLQTAPWEVLNELSTPPSD
ncbi:GIY-YIG nuclease family protein [Pyruvatibacter mobilis]|uniref:GIY-YIG nuclease family protein n=1 Tax=Pyruvatibacter mobilis TaxID=1712261 RepID=UPI0014517157|nr:GIY-YIG nuclease family protein [Pyruvatibacter mobilis]QJD74009.1 GIY-YIG nuclease family protein [Pyruvatibacter mobilis]